MQWEYAGSPELWIDPFTVMVWSWDRLSVLVWDIALDWPSVYLSMCVINDSTEGISGGSFLKSTYLKMSRGYLSGDVFSFRQHFKSRPKRQFYSVLYCLHWKKKKENAGSTLKLQKSIAQNIWPWRHVNYLFSLPCIFLVCENVSLML